MKIRWVAIVAVATGSGSVSGQEPGKPAAVSDIERVWTARQTATKSFRVAWTATVWTAKGSLDEESGFPPADSQHEESGELAVRDDRLRLELRGKTFSTITGAWEPDGCLCIFDGKSGSYARNAIVDNYTCVTLERGRLPLYTTHAALSPVWGLYRPQLAAVQMVDIDIYKRTGRTTVIGGLRCEELSNRSPNGVVVGHVWLTADEAHLPVRSLLEYSNDPISSIQRDIQYTTTPTAILPKSWTIATRDRKGAVASRLTVRATSVEVNCDIPPETFDLSPPRRSVVTVFANNGPEAKYLVRDDGQKQSVPTNQHAALFADLLNSADQSGGGSAGAPWRLVGAVSLFVGAVLLFLVARYRRTRS